MKIIKTCQINGEELELAEEQLFLELSNTGRGFITVHTDSDCIGKSVIFELGEYDDYFRWFNGFVESEQPAENGYKKLFVRELAARFERPLNCSHRHITLKALCAWLTEQTGIPFKTPDQPYSDEPIAHFTHSGSGYQLLHNIGRQFQIPHYIWQQSPDGSIFVGSWSDSMWAEESAAITLDNEDVQSHSGNEITIPIQAGIRPGALVNGKRIKKVELRNEFYRLSWEELDDNGKPLQKSPERRQIENAFPELAGGYHLPKRGRVVGVADPSGAGDISDPFRPKYAVEVQLLDENGEEDSTVPVYSAVPLPITSAASQGGDFCFPEIGTIVELGFANGRSDQPFVRSFSSEGKTLPAVAPGEMLRQQRPEVFERTDQAGNMHKETDQTISEKSYQRKIQTDSEHKQVGTAQKEVQADYAESVGGNKQTHVIGNAHEIVASDKRTGVGGVFELVSGVRSELKAPQSFVGSEGQNIFRILETFLDITEQLANELARHKHSGSPPPNNSAKISALGAQIGAEKGKLSPIIV